MAVQAPYPIHPYGQQLGEVPVDGCVQRANAGFLAPGQTKIAVTVDKVSTTDAAGDFIPLPTPQSGKVWCITDMTLTHDQTSTQRMALTVGGVTEFVTSCHGSTAPDIMDGIETQPDVPGGLQPVLAVTGAASMHTFATFFGFQQSIGVG